MFVADTNVISMTDPTKSGRFEGRFDWDAASIYLTTVTVAEVRSGILRLRRAGASRKAEELASWWDGVETFHSDRILTFDLEAAIAASELHDRAAALGQNPGWPDIQIAAIATSRGFTVLTRNTRHFAPLGVPHLDPFAGGQPD